MSEHISKETLVSVLSEILSDDRSIDILQELINNKVSKIGDTMTGPLKINNPDWNILSTERIIDGDTIELRLESNPLNGDVYLIKRKNGINDNQLYLGTDRAEFAKPLSIAGGGTGATTFSGYGGLLNKLFEKQHTTANFFPAFGDGWTEGGYLTKDNLYNLMWSAKSAINKDFNAYESNGYYQLDGSQNYANAPSGAQYGWGLLTVVNCGGAIFQTVDTLAGGVCKRTKSGWPMKWNSWAYHNIHT